MALPVKPSAVAVSAVALLLLLIAAWPSSARQLSSERLSPEQCVKAGTELQDSLIGKLIPCLFNQKSSTCCNALTDLFGPDNDEESDLEYCLCNADYLTELQNALANIPFVTLDLVLEALEYCQVPHARPDGSFPNCEKA
mmetsp:Transcript_25341/g.70889  ORF Transcript_25341/g.70889 Transcript_25341/m.70889 type:complete len:140 (+) Transcript_25341:123-542(+)|eukprot:CAMPEP_0117649924 /NCGR_PEP_ID=MMETSP0804-20121206/1256_1 /TAXON_ID=1074897 /ORGANISM="Tetraselmis astigmatica, Strain CCMP880" /LENGTH=139 /DNA_ID=CAMNT_0005455743 /DNA_START=58 /DNA_END=477 /DNA_ORIENTATION=+